MHTAPLLTFKSHVAGKNCDVSIFPDRVEWSKPKSLTNRGNASEMIPVKGISSVVTERSGMAMTTVRLITSGNTIDFRFAHKLAEQVKATVVPLLLGTPSAPPPPAHAAPPPPPPMAAAVPQALVADELRKLVELKEMGALTDDEFMAQKTRLLSA